jgi:thiol-disulfide isomerase/thioredoxin
MGLTGNGSSTLSIILIVLGFLQLGCTSGSKTASPSPLRVVDGEAMLLGPMTSTSLFEHFAIFRDQYDAYAPDSATLIRLKNYPIATEIRVFVGTWCIDSKRHLPSFLRIMDQANNERLTYSLYGLDRSKRDSEGMSGRYGITRVPTMVFLQNGAEIGRMTERPNRSMENDILNILFRSESD